VVTIVTALLLFNAFTLAMAGVGNLFWGRALWAVAIGPVEVAGAAAMVTGALHFRRGHRTWWRLLFLLVLLHQGQIFAESWIVHHEPNPQHVSSLDYVWPFVWVTVEWTLLLLPATRRYLGEVGEWYRREKEHAEAGHFAPAGPE
jgi:hypothetical protein